MGKNPSDTLMRNMGDTNSLFSKPPTRKSLFRKILRKLMGTRQAAPSAATPPPPGPQQKKRAQAARRKRAAEAQAGNSQAFASKPGSELIHGFLSASFDAPGPQAPIRCACVCAIKDEAPYIHEYVHHHLWFGFDPIIVILNRTSDASREILRKISAKHPQVLCFDCDWVDLMHPDCSLIQRVAYAYGLSYLRRHGLATHALLSDADEFWYTKDFQTKIDAWIRSIRNGDFDQVSFPWHNQNAPEQRFEPPFRNPKVQASRTVKSIVRVSSPLVEPQPHHSRFAGPITHLDSRGVDFIKQAKPPFQFAGDPDDQAAYVLHRIQRSEDEYLISLVRGNPKDHKALKDNRTGYMDTASVDHGIDSQQLIRYWASLETMISECGITHDIMNAKEGKISEISAFEETVEGFLRNSDQPEKTYKTLRQILSGTRYEGRWG